MTLKPIDNKLKSDSLLGMKLVWGRGYIVNFVARLIAHRDKNAEWDRVTVEELVDKVKRETPFVRLRDLPQIKSKYSFKQFALIATKKHYETR